MNGGFTLLETLVAFVVLSLVTATAFMMFGDSFRGVARIEAHDVATARAQNLLSLIVKQKELATGDFEGLTIVSTPIAGPGPAGWQPMRVQIAAEGALLVDTVVMNRVKP